jgi:hypothetical protein
VREVTAQLVELGEPVDRPAFGGAPGSEPFNSFGGLNNIYVADRVFTASWSAVVQEEEAVVRVYWHYLIAFDGEVLARRSPIEFEEVGGRTFEQNAADNVASLQRWAAGMGFVGCDGCS